MYNYISMKKGSKYTREQRKKILNSHKKDCVCFRCSGRAWNRGIKRQLNTGRTLFRKGQIPWNKGLKGIKIGPQKGVKFTQEHKEKISKARIGNPKIMREKHHNWKGGITEKNHKIRESIEYKEWRKDVLKRDNWSCVNCGYRSKYSKKAGYKKCDIRVDHIKPFCLYPELRFEISNGRVLCVECDKKLGWNYKRKVLLNEK